MGAAISEGLNGLSGLFLSRRRRSKQTKGHAAQVLEPDLDPDDMVVREMRAQGLHLTVIRSLVDRLASLRRDRYGDYTDLPSTGFEHAVADEKEERKQRVPPSRRKLTYVGTTSKRKMLTKRKAIYFTTVTSPLLSPGDLPERMIPRLDIGESAWQSWSQRGYLLPCWCRWRMMRCGRDDCCGRSSKGVWEGASPTDLCWTFVIPRVRGACHEWILIRIRILLILLARI